MPRSRCTLRSVSPSRFGLVAVEARRRFVEQHQLAARSSARVRSRRAGRRRGSATRPSGRRHRIEPSRSSISCTRACSPRVGRPRKSTSFQSAPRPLRTRSVTSRCSRGVMPVNSSMRWKVRAMPSRARRYVGYRVRSRPSKVTVPPSGFSMPSRQLKNVVLPAPFGPMSPTISRSSTSSDTSSSAVIPANVFVISTAWRSVMMSRSPARAPAPRRSCPTYPRLHHSRRRLVP